MEKVHYNLDVVRRRDGTLEVTKTRQRIDPQDEAAGEYPKSDINLRGYTLHPPPEDGRIHDLPQV